VSALVKHFIETGSLDEYLELSDKDDGVDTLTLDARLCIDESGYGNQTSAEAAIPHAEIESSAPYQPFHTDRRVSLLEYTSLEHTSIRPKQDMGLGRGAAGTKGSSQAAWAFGQEITAVRLSMGHPAISHDDDGGEHRALPASAMERVLRMAPNDDEIVVTTRKRRHRQGDRVDADDGFFEDDCEVLDFADQRV
jgi:hypothetical protein